MIWFDSTPILSFIGKVELHWITFLRYRHVSNPLHTSRRAAALQFTSVSVLLCFLLLFWFMSCLCPCFIIACFPCVSWLITPLFSTLAPDLCTCLHPYVCLSVCELNILGVCAILTIFYLANRPTYICSDQFSAFLIRVLPHFGPQPVLIWLSINKS